MLHTTVSIVISNLVLAAVSIQLTCFPASVLESYLVTRWTETRIAGGPTNNGLLVERWEAKSGTWTITVRNTEGTLCMLAAGQDWREASKREGEPL